MLENIFTKKSLFFIALIISALFFVACSDDSDSSTIGAPDTASNNTTSNNTASNNTTSNNTTSNNTTSNNTSTSGITDITDAIFSNTSSACAEYTGNFASSVMDLGRDLPFLGAMGVTSDAAGCTITTNSIPNHDFNDLNSFATPVSEVSETFSFSSAPSAASSTTGLTLEYDNAIFRNGVKLDLLAAACYGVGNEPLGQEKIGCFQSGTPWRYDPMFSGNDFGTDHHNAHTQPNGGYHYHGSPNAMFDDSGEQASGVIGFAADGFPIYGPYFDDKGTIRRATSGFELKPGMRESQSGEGAFPGGSYDGTFVDDYIWVDGAGDLDECNGMTINDTYAYYITDAYPWVLGCFKGTPDSSFRKSMP